MFNSGNLLSGFGAEKFPSLCQKHDSKIVNFLKEDFECLMHSLQGKAFKGSVFNRKCKFINVTEPGTLVFGGL